MRTFINKQSIFFLVILLWGIACARQTATDSDCATLACQRQQAYDQVMAVHDEVMARMPQLDSLAGLLKERLNTPTDSLQAVEVQQALTALEAADQAMWDWMHGFDANGIKALPDSLALARLRLERQRIDSVARLFDSATSAANHNLR
ncbi:MAG TPA: hypothetical protein ENJ39_00755 [Flammeovirgaceae bacterium]|nr:hypothetical protein [Flammeovirgaceae bacterium]